MARHSGPVHDWGLGLLNLVAEDRILDVGCGPGIALAMAGDLAREGHVVGVDSSPVMVAQARRRNRAAVAAGRVAVRSGDVASLPSPPGAFTAAYSANCLPFWLSRSCGLAELRRVLRPGGGMVLVVRMHREDVSPANPSARGFTEDQLERLVSDVRHSGFGPVVVHRRQWPRETTAAVLASGRRAGDRPG